MQNDLNCYYITNQNRTSYIQRHWDSRRHTKPRSISFQNFKCFESTQKFCTSVHSIYFIVLYLCSVVLNLGSTRFCRQISNFLKCSANDCFANSKHFWSKKSRAECFSRWKLNKFTRQVVLVCTTWRTITSYNKCIVHYPPLSQYLIEESAICGSNNKPKIRT